MRYSTLRVSPPQRPLAAFATVLISMSAVASLPSPSYSQCFDGSAVTPDGHCEDLSFSSFSADQFANSSGVLLRWNLDKGHPDTQCSYKTYRDNKEITSLEYDKELDGWFERSVPAGAYSYKVKAICTANSGKINHIALSSSQQVTVRPIPSYLLCFDGSSAVYDPLLDIGVCRDLKFSNFSVSQVSGGTDVKLSWSLDQEYPFLDYASCRYTPFRDNRQITLQHDFSGGTDRNVPAGKHNYSVDAQCTTDSGESKMVHLAVAGRWTIVTSPALLLQIRTP